MSQKEATIFIFMAISLSSAAVIAFLFTVELGHWTYDDYLRVLGALPAGGGILWLLVALAARRFRDTIAITLTGLFAHGVWSGSFIALFYLVVGIYSSTEGAGGTAGGIFALLLILALVAAAPVFDLWVTWHLSRHIARLLGARTEPEADGPAVSSP